MLPIDVMDHLRALFGIDPRRFQDLTTATLEEIADVADAEIEMADDAGDREILVEIQRYALSIIEARGDNDPDDTVKPEVQLSGTDGNVFAIIGAVRRVLVQHDREHDTALAPEFVTRAFASESYDDVLRLCMEYCNVR